MPRIQKVLNIFEREEELYYIPTKGSSACLEAIKKMMKRKVYNARTPITSTIYLNNDEHEMPWWISLKLRRYLPRFLKPFLFYPEKNYFIDVKLSRSLMRERREKGRYYWTGQAILDFFNKGTTLMKSSIPAFLLTLRDEIFTFPLTQPLRIYTGVECRREHYFTRDKKIYVTIDKDIVYYYFSRGSFKAKKLGEEKGIRVEIKCPPKEVGSKQYKEIRKIIESCIGVSVISKKYNGYNLLTKATIYEKGEELKNELPNREIETKLMIDPARSNFFLADLKQNFQKGLVPGFGISQSFPYVLETGNFVEYYATKNAKTEALKFMYKGEWAQVVIKEEYKTVPTEFTFPVMDRKEHKPTGYVFLFQDLDREKWIEERRKRLGPIHALENFFRARKVFWLDNEQTGRVYHISIDHSVASRRHFAEVEIEYSGRYRHLIFKTPNPEKEIIEDIGYITSSLLRLYPRDILTPTTLTKFQWISGQK